MVAASSGTVEYMFAASSGTVEDMFAASSGTVEYVCCFKLYSRVYMYICRFKRYSSLLLARCVFGVLNVGTTEEETLRPNYAAWDDCAAASITPETPRQLVLSIH